MNARASEADARCPCGALADGWPGDDGDVLCQDCWEKACDDDWWRVHQRLARILHPETFPQAEEVGK